MAIETKYALRYMTEAISAAKSNNQSEYEYIGEVSRDIRNPMNIILGMSDLALANEDLDPKTADYIKKIESASKVLFESLEQLIQKSLKGLTFEREMIEAYDDYRNELNLENREIDINFMHNLLDIFLHFTTSEMDAPKEEKPIDVGYIDYETEKNRNINFAGKRIMVVEDNEINRDIAQTLLEMKNAQVVTACDGVEARDLFEKSEESYYDAVLMDIHMPNMDGMEASRTIRSMNRKDAKCVPIIAMTANAMPECIKEALRSGMNSHIGKPVDTEKLYRILDYFLR